MKESSEFPINNKKNYFKTKWTYQTSIKGHVSIWYSHQSQHRNTNTIGIDRYLKLFQSRFSKLFWTERKVRFVSVRARSETGPCRYRQKCFRCWKLRTMLPLTVEACKASDETVRFFTGTDRCVPVQQLTNPGQTDFENLGFNYCDF